MDTYLGIPDIFDDTDHTGVQQALHTNPDCILYYNSLPACIGYWHSSNSCHFEVQSKFRNSCYIADNCFDHQNNT